MALTVDGWLLVWGKFSFIFIFYFLFYLFILFLFFLGGEGALLGAGWVCT